MKAGWEVKTLGDVATLQRGFDLPKKNRTAGQFPLVTSSGPTDTHNEAKVAGPGVVTGRSGSIGNVFFIEEDFWPLNTALYIKNFHGNDERFIWYLLQAFNLKQFSSGSGVPTLNRNNVHGERVFVPKNIEEQKRIVAVLDAAFEGLDRARAHTEANLQNARELFESGLNSVFFDKKSEWPEKQFDEVCEKIQDGAHHSPKETFTEMSESLFPYVTSKNIRTNYMKLDTLQFVKKDFHDSIYSSCKPELDDVLLTKDGASTGNVCLNEFSEPISLLSSVCLIKPKKDIILSKFILYYIQSPHGFKQLTGKMTGAAIKRIILRTIKASIIPVPSLEQQTLTCERLDELYERSRELTEQYQSKLTDLDDLRQSLLAKAFAGELT